MTKELIDSKLKVSKTVDLNKVGVAMSVRDDVVYAKGMRAAKMNELVYFITGSDEVLYGVINSLDDTGNIGITVLGDISEIFVGMFVVTMDKQPVLRAGLGILGRVVDCVGNPVDGKEEIKEDKNTENVIIEENAPGIIERQPVRESLETGIKFVDSMIPIGCGQRELIIGDSKTGKTTVAVDTIINQKGKGVICVYVAVGQRAQTVRSVTHVLEQKGCMEYTTVVAATAADSSVMQYMAPFAGCAVAEYFMARGFKTLVIYDDLSKHAVAYRQMSLLLRRPPGREGYPGDVFYLHSRLLERSAKLKEDENGIGGSITALPIIETIDGDVSAYIPTNVISITDGQIYLEKNLFNKGILPAISPGISVSRVGSAAQNKIMKELAGSLKLELAQFTELQEFARLGLDLDEQAKYTLSKGERLQSLMIQNQYSPVPMHVQITGLIAGLNGFLNKLVNEKIGVFLRKLEYVFRQAVVKVVLTKSLKKLVPVEAVTFVINYILARLAK